MRSGPVTLVNDPSAFMVANVTGTPMTGFPAGSVYVINMLQVFWFVADVTTQEPEIANLLCSERTPAPIVVDAEAVVEAVDASITLVDVPTSAAPTMEPCPGNAWFVATDVCATVEDAVLDAVSAVATPAEKTTTAVTKIRNVMRCDCISLRMYHGDKCDQK